MNDESVFSPLRVLVVEAEPALRQALMQLLSEEGYVPSGIASLEEALAAVEETAFELMLADLIAGKSRHSFTPAHILRRHTLSTPMGLLTDEDISPWDKRRNVFAFILSKPIETARLLTEVAACLKRPVSRAQARQAEVLRCFVEAILARRWRRLLSLSTEDMHYYPPGSSFGLTIGPMQGASAIEAYASSLWQDAPCLRLEVNKIYCRPRGLALRYLRFAPTADDGWAWQEGTQIFQFVGDRISAIGFPDYENPLHKLNQIRQVG